MVYFFMSKNRKLNKYVEKSSSSFINKVQLDKIKKKFLKSNLEKYRILFHRDKNSKIHEMIIFLKKNFDMPIHCNYNIEKSYFIIEGKFDLNFYNKKNKFLSKVKLDEKKKFFLSFQKKNKS